MPRVITNKVAQGNIQGTGAVKDIYDSRDYKWSEIAHGVAPFNWGVGFDIEQKIGIIKVKDQNGSSSCGGQAWSYYSSVIEAIATHSLEERSAKFIYAQTAVQGGGSAGRTNSELCKESGVCIESLCPSYENNNPPSESFMTRKEDITEAALWDAKKNKALAYALVDIDIDDIAQAIEQNGGVVIGITGENNGTWLSPFPQPPVHSAWNHWVYVGKAKIINGKKMIGFLNSWGENCGDKGWQWIGEDYLKALKGQAVWSVWTMTYNPNPVTHYQHFFYLSLRQGIVNTEVNALQKALQADGCFPSGLKTTNFFGTITKNSVKKFQEKYGLKVDGIVGKITNGKLNELFAK